MIADQPARRREEGEPGLAAARGAHLHELAAPPAELFHDHPGIGVVDVDLHLLDRLQPLAGRRVGAIEHARAADRQLEALAPHGLDEDAELQLAAARDLEGVAALGLGDADGDVAFGLAPQARADHAAGDLVALEPGERRIVDRDRDRQGRRVYGLGGDRFGHNRLANRVGDRRLGQSGDRHDVAGHGLGDRHPLEAAKREQLGQARLLDDAAVAAERLQRHVQPRRAGVDAAGEHAAEIGIVFEDRRQHGERRGGVALGQRHVARDQVE